MLRSIYSENAASAFGVLPLRESITYVCCRRNHLRVAASISQENYQLLSAEGQDESITVNFQRRHAQKLD